MALALSKFEIPSLLIDRRKSNYSEPRAHALNPRTLEIFSSLGMDVDDFKAVATPTEESCWVRWLDTLDGGEYGKLPYERMHAKDDLPTPWPLFNVAQPATETVMQNYVERESSIQTLRPWQWKSCEYRDGGIESLVIDDQGQERRIFSRYLIGADGAGSPVRESQNIKMNGMGIIHDFMMIHFKADLTEVVKNKPAILYWVMKQDCSGTLIAYDMRGNWVFMHGYDDADTDISIFTEDYCETLLKKAIGRSDIDIEIISRGNWGLGSQVSESYRKGNIFLIGDAAHRYPPSGGLGLNTGVGDAHNLAWKIAGVLQDWAWPDLLESYHSEREHVAQINAAFSTENAGKLFSIVLATRSLMPNSHQPSFETLKSDPEIWAEIEAAIREQRDHFDGLALQIGQHYGRKNAPDLRADDFQFNDVGARFPHTWLTIAGKRASSLVLLSAKQFTVIARSGVQIPKIKTNIPFQVKTENTDFAADKANLKTIGLNDVAAIIVRPDGHIAARLIGPKISQSEIDGAFSRAIAKFTGLRSSDPVSAIEGRS